MMRKNFIWAGTVLVLSLIETTWLSVVQVQGVLPSLVLLLVVYYALAEGEERAMFTGLLGGLLQDVQANSSLGHHIVCYVIVGYVAGRISTRLVTEHPAVKAGMVFFASVLNGVLYTLIQYVQTPHMRAFYYIGTSVVPSAFYTALFTPLVFFFLIRTVHRQAPAPGGV
jgi:rod shape-determining protein MreD